MTLYRLSSVAEQDFANTSPAQRPGLCWQGRQLLFIAAALLGTPIAIAAPPLPTPCVGASCGGNGFLAAGQAGAAITGTTLSVTQTSANAILNWADFNIAAGYTVNFVQPSKTSATLNNIFSASPSTIAGQLNANGQVYLYNQNGILFDKGAQVNVGGLVASTLQLPDALFLNGILSQPSTGGYTSPAVFQAAGSGASTVTVNPGATLSTSDGGRIMLLGSAVSNAGKLSTPDGQTILGAGNTVYLAAATDPSLRGLLIEVKGNTLANSVTNTGQVTADRGNVTFAGFVVNQAGTVTATTSVSANGSIYLVAGDTSGDSGNYYYASTDQPFGALLPNNGGNLTLAAGSLTQVLPDATDTATLTAAQQQNFIPSQVNLVGGRIYLQGNASVVAPSGRVYLNAATDPFAQTYSPSDQSPTSDGVSRIYLDSGSRIDVSGLSDVALPATQNILSVTLEANDLQNDPLLRTGFLHGLTVTFDARGPLPTLFNAQPYIDNIGAGIQQMLTSGGSIGFDSAGDTIVRAGASLNVSGGSIAYQGGYAPPTTKLLGANGITYGIASAPNDIQYVGLANAYKYTDPTWGATNSTSETTYYPGYLQGANAGQIQVQSPQAYLMGTLSGETEAGPYQRSPGSLPLGGSLVIGAPSSQAIPDLRAPSVLLSSQTATDILGTAFNYTDPTTLLPQAQQSTLTLSAPTLSAAGFSRLSIYSNGSVTLPADTSLNLGANGQLQITSLTGIGLDGSISAPGGSVLLTTKASEPGDPNSHDIVVGTGASISTAGGWINDSPLLNTGVPTAPTIIDGGRVTANADGNIILAAGSALDVSGGAWLNAAGTLMRGAAGAITLSSRFTTSITGLPPYTGELQIAPTALLSGYSLAAGKGGALSLQSGSVTLGDAPAGLPGELLLSPGFFQHGGFKSYAITGLDALSVGGPDGVPVTVQPLQQTWMLNSNAANIPTGISLGSFATAQLLPAYLRSAASLSLNTAANVFGFGDLTLGAGSAVIVDPQGAVSLAATGLAGSLSILGSISAPAGTIALQLATPQAVGGLQDPGYSASQQIYIGPSAVLAAPAFARIDTADVLGYREGSVLAGGRISLEANKGSIVTAPGSVLDVSGTAGTLDILGPGTVTPTLVAGNAGSIVLEAREGLALGGALRGFAADVPGAAGGTLTVGLDLFDYLLTATTTSGLPYPLTQRNLTLTGLPAANLPLSQPGGNAVISTQTLSGGGFDAISIRSSDIITLAGTVSLSTRGSLVLDAPILAAEPGATVALQSAYLGLGNYFNTEVQEANPATVATQYSVPDCIAAACSGRLTATAQLIDIRGASAWTGFASESLISSGDLRLAPAQTPYVTGNNASVLPSALNVSGDLTLQATQVYPTTATVFDLSTLGAVTIQPQSTSLPAVPLSAGGELTITAGSIAQNGVLRAPLGELSLDATGAAGAIALGSGSVTSVSASGATLPLGSTVNGTQWTYTLGQGVTQVLTAPPAKTINLNGASVNVASGATVDLSGGGDLYAYEWIAGPGGSSDVLAASGGRYSYAIVPTLGSAFAPIDPQYGSTIGTSSGQTIYLSGVPGLAAGTYALLPARYALLPGAYAISLVASGSDLALGTAIKQPDGSYLVAGQLGVPGTQDLSSRTSSYLLAPSTVVQTQAQYTSSYGNSFFSNAAATTGSVAPRLPADAGLLQLAATTGLTLDGTISFSTGSFTTGTDSNGKAITESGIGGVVSINAPQIMVVDSNGVSAPVNGTLQLSAKTLDGLNAQTLILGATESNNSTGTLLSVQTTQAVELKNTTDVLSAPQVILSALDTVTLDAGAQVASSGVLTQTATPITLQGGGALLRLSAGGLSPLLIDPAVAQNPGGALSIGAGASVSAGAGSLMLYGSGSTTLDPTSAVSSSAVGVYSNRISIGDVPAGASAPQGLILTNQLLSQLHGLTALTLGSTSTIDLYGAVQLGTDAALGELTLDAGGIGGYGTGSKTLQAGALLLSNSGNVAANFASAPTGSGVLDLIATASAESPGQITLAGGSKTLAGFGAVSLAADGAIVGQGTGMLSVVPATGAAPVSVSLQASTITGASGSQQTLTTSGPVTLAAPAKTITSTAAGLGASLAIQGSSIQDAAVVLLPAGDLTLHASTGDVTLGAGAQVSVAGTAPSFVVTDAVASAGVVNLTADLGNVTLASGSSVNLAGAASSTGGAISAAGSLSVSAPNGQATLAGAMSASAAPAAAGGNFSLDARSITSLSALNLLLGVDGFTGQVSERARTGDLTIAAGDQVRASSYQLVADQGSISVAGSISTSGTAGAADPSGGSISLRAGQNLTVLSGAVLSSDAAPPAPGAAAARGGEISLAAAQGSLDLQGGQLSLRGSGAGAQDGTLTLIAPRTADQGNLQLTAEAASVITQKPIVVEGLQTYAMSAAPGSTVASLGAAGKGDVPLTAGGVAVLTGSGQPVYQNLSLSTSGSGVLYNQAQTFSASAPMIAAALAPGLGLSASNIEVRPGIEIDSASNLTLASSWDLGVGGAWHFNAAPINLTLRSAGTLLLSGSLSDGFSTTAATAATHSTLTSCASGEACNSASFRLTAGADLSSADPGAIIAQPTALAGVPGTGNVILTPGNLVRTGTGSIAINAGGDVLLGYDPVSQSFSRPHAQASVVYTAGIADPLPAADANLFVAPVGAGRNVISPTYATGGGNVSVSAAMDIQSAPSAQLVTDWQWRSGQVDSSGNLIGPAKNTTWYLMLNDFQQGIGALGGGNVSLLAGRDITNVSAVIPTTGRLLGAAGTPATAGQLVVDGGGTLSVAAGRNIAGGSFDVDQGLGTLSAGGGILSGATLGQTVPSLTATSVSVPLTTPLYPVLVLGNSQISVQALQSVTLDLITNGTSLPETQANYRAAGNAYSFFFTYGASSAANVTSVGADVNFNNGVANLPVSLLNTAATGNVYDLGYQDYLYPPTINAAALSGNIYIGNGGFALYPSATGNLRLLADQGITGDAANTAAEFGLQMLEAAPLSLQNPALPGGPFTLTQLASIALPQVPLHQADPTPVEIVAKNGSITISQMLFPKATDVIAGQDIIDLNLTDKNLNPGDVTLVEAGRDIAYTTPTDPVTNQLLSNYRGISVGGPGFVEVLAGRNLNLGDSNGIVSTGSLSDARLPSLGAALVIGAGMAGSTGALPAPDYRGFTATYLAPSATGSQSIYASQLVNYMQQINPLIYSGIDYADALTAFQSLPPRQQLPLIADVLSAELSATGIAHNTQGTSYQRGYDAINALFPATDAQGKPIAYQGDINMFFSQLKTEQGGDINLLDPGGSVVVGVPNVPAALNTVKSGGIPPIPADAQLGVLVLASGAIQGFANQDFDVNQSRMLTLQGGNIILWASQGNIDAGKGAKSASGAPPPVIQTDSKGNVFVNPIGAVSGSGIGQLLTVPGLVPGLVNLIAPKGDVNAGDAGIRVAGNLNIAAVQVIGANNITVGGSSSGVPSSEAGALSGALSGANSLGDAGKSAVDQLSQSLASNANSFAQMTDTLQPAFIVVKMFCLGVDCESH